MPKHESESPMSSTSRSCPDWPALLEVAPDLHFKHYTLGEARLPAEVLVTLPDIPIEAVAICADLEHNVFNPATPTRRRGRAAGYVLVCSPSGRAGAAG